MLTKEEVKKFYPQLISRILLYLRQQRYHKMDILTEDLIEKFDKSKSIISQALTILAEQDYINKNYVSYLNSHGSRHKISITNKGLEIAEGILAEGLDPFEKKVIKASNKKRKRIHIR